MSIWDKDRLLGGLRMDKEYESGTAFALYGMKVAGELPADIGDASYDGPATKTVLLTEEIVREDGRFVPLGERVVKVVGTLSGPIAEMASVAESSDFPAIVSWDEVPTKRAAKAVVLNFIAVVEDGPLLAPESEPEEWASY